MTKCTTKNFGWVTLDTYCYAIETHTTSSIPTLIPGTVYGIQYTCPFSYTRTSSTHCAMDSSGDSLQYNWSGVCKTSKRMEAGMNFMFVIGSINGCQERLQLVLFYNPGSSISAGSDCDTSAEGVDVNCNQVWLPAIFNPDTGVLFSEVGRAQVSGSRDNLIWTSYSTGQSLGCSGGTHNVTTSFAEVKATIIDSVPVVSHAMQLLQGVLRHFQESSACFAQFVDLSAVSCLVPGPGSVVQTPVCDHHQVVGGTMVNGVSAELPPADCSIWDDITQPVTTPSAPCGC